MSKKEQEAYVKWADENVKARQQFFASLDVGQVADELAHLSPKRRKRGAEKLLRQPDDDDNASDVEKIKSSPKLATRHSSRLLAKQLQLLQQEAGPDSSYLPSMMTTTSSSPPPPTIEPKNHWNDDCSISTDCSRQEMMAIFNKCGQPMEIRHHHHHQDGVDFSRVSFVSPIDVMSLDQRATSIAVHASPSPILTAIGNKTGQIVFLSGISDDNDDDDENLPQQHRFQVHDRHEFVVATLFEPSYCHHFLSAGCKTLRSFDLRQPTTTKLLYKTDSNIFLTSIGVDVEQQSPNKNHHHHNNNSCCLNGDTWVSLSDGTVARIDWRSSNVVPIGIYRINNVAVNSVSFSKADDWLFTASCDGTVAVWDVRKIPPSNYTYRRTTALASSQYDGENVKIVAANPRNPNLLLTESVGNNDGGVNIRILRFKEGLDHFAEAWSTRQTDGAGNSVCWHPLGNVFATGGATTISVFKATSDKITWRTSTTASSSWRPLFCHCTDVITHKPPSTTSQPSPPLLQTYVTFHPTITSLLLTASANSTNIVKFKC